VPAASLRDVAQRADVSLSTVSNVLNHPDRVAPETIERVERAIRDLDFVRNHAARQLRVGHSSMIALMVLDIGNPYFTAMARGAEERARQLGYSIIISDSDDRRDVEAQYLDAFKEQRVRGIIISPVGQVEPTLIRLGETGIPSVLIKSRETDLSSVSVDGVAGGRLAVGHLLETGRRRIAFVGGPFGTHAISDRLDGARSAVAAVPGATLELIGTDALSVVAGRAVGEAIAARPPDHRPEAVFAVNDLVAVGLLEAFVMKGGIRVPEDIAISGYDDIDFAASAVVPLTTVRQPASEMGRAAVDLILREEQKPEQVLFQPELVVRAST
jgi:LacI family transcriptional regulator